MTGAEPAGAGDAAGPTGAGNAAGPTGTADGTGPAGTGDGTGPAGTGDDTGPAGTGVDAAPAAAGGLSEQELAVWHAVKSLGSMVVRRIGTDLTAATGLSGTDYGVISRLAELGGGRLGQQVLADSMQLTKGAMSHQLTRMAERGLITRDKGPAGVTVTLTPYGGNQLRRARPVHAVAVRKHLIGLLSDEERDMLLRVARRLNGTDGEPGERHE